MQWMRVPVSRCGHFTSPALASIALLVPLTGELHAQGKGMRLWNLTTSTIRSRSSSARQNRSAPARPSRPKSPPDDR